ncbi:unnamed protein product [Calicophoron daubneyi]|uniref:Junctophilin n=1 Tax=Calicophoron daubneyi TaxID=300641 RepID=A0AAV2T2V9_CALDB
MIQDPKTQEATCLPAGKYEFRDNGLYIGEWLNEKAVGLGLITKDKCQGEYTGLWDNGEEKSGVFLWPNAPGAMYEGEWAHNRRNGYGVFTREDWVIMGKFVDDFISVGIKCKEDSIGRFEGEFENGLPVFGVETYADGGTYAGEYKNGIRQGLGVRTSIPYGDVINFFPEEAAIAAEMASRFKKKVMAIAGVPAASNQEASDHSSNGRRGSLISQRSGDVAELENVEAGGMEEEEPYSGRKPNPASTGKGGMKDLRLSTKFKCGFVLSSQRSELVIRRQNKLYGISNHSTPRRSREAGGRSGQKRARSLTNLFHRSLSRESISRFRRQGSANERTISPPFQEETQDSVFTLDLEDAIDPETVETYSGQWDSDVRQGYGVCERSDGVTYEGHWLKNQRHGYGQTRFQDGTCEQGRYHFGKLVFLSWSKGTKPHMLLYNYHIMREVAASVKRARSTAEQARLRAAEATDNLENVTTCGERSKLAAEMARDYSLETRQLVKEMYPEFEQPGIKYMEDMVCLMRVTKRGNQVFEAALNAAHEALASVQLEPTDEGDGENKVDEEPFELPSPVFTPPPKKGNPVSRAGSYRLKRRQRSERHKTKKSNYSSQLDTPDQTSRNADAAQANNHRQGSLTIVVPQIKQPAQFYLPDTNHNSSEPAGSDQQRDYLQVPGSRPHDGDDNDSSSDEESGRKKVSRTPSNASNYVIMPTLSEEQMATLPKVTLTKLMTNARLTDDHFDQYNIPARASTESEMYAAEQDHPRPVNHIEPTASATSPQLTDYKLSDGHPAKNDCVQDGVKSGLVRRRTLPTFIDRPVITKPKIHLPKLPEKDVAFSTPKSREDGAQKPSPTGRRSPIGDRPSGARGSVVLRQRVIGGSPEGEENRSIYLIEEGVRKRLHAEPNTASPLIIHSMSKTQQEESKLPTAHSPSGTSLYSQTRETIPNRLRLTDSTYSGTSSGSSKGSNDRSLTVKPLSVVANVLLEDIQDELPPLPTHFRESTLDLNQKHPE